MWSQIFSRFAHWASLKLGHPLAFILAVLSIVIWALTGPFFNFSDTWQLVVNTSTTIITFLMVFLIQNTQNRDSEAVQVKLDELIRAIKDADNELIDIENMTDEELNNLQASYAKLAQATREELKQNAQSIAKPRRSR
jgi:low affinity Fe/Cu permease